MPDQSKLPPTAESRPAAVHGWGRLVAWWRSLSRRNQWLTGVGVVVVLLVIVAVSPLRYPIVGLVHKGSLDLTVQDDTTHQPLPGARVAVGSHTAVTDGSGHAMLRGLPLGNKKIVVSAANYNTKTITHVLFWSSVHLGIVAVHSNGVPVKFSVRDFVSDKPVAGAMLSFGAAMATTASDGTATLSIAPGSVKGASVSVSDSGFNTQSVTISDASKQVSVSLVPAGKVYFLSNRSGRIDLYASNLDGSAQTVLLKGTGKESAETGILPNTADQNQVALLSSRLGHKDSSGDTVDDLFAFDTSSRSLKLVAQNVTFGDFRGWSGENLIYQVDNIPLGPTLTTSNLYAYSVSTGKTIQLASESGLSVLLLHKGTLYYSVSESQDSSRAGTYALSVSGGPARRISPLDTDLAVQLSPTSVYLEHTDDSTDAVTWRTLNLATQQVSSGSAPSTQNSRTYVESPDGAHSVFIDTRDQQTDLYLTGADGTSDTKLPTNGTANQFVQWYQNRYIAYSASGNQTGIFIVSIAGGPAHKVTDSYDGNGATYGGGYNGY